MGKVDMDDTHKDVKCREEIYLPDLSAVAKERAACLARDFHARPLVVGKRVCDAACGVGYGSFYLAEVADRVIGMDLGEEEIAWADRYYKRDNVSFLRADLCMPWPVDGLFDVVTSFETLEHLNEPDQFLTLVRERLKAGGQVLLSVPNGVLDAEHHPEDDRHVQHFTQESLRSLIVRHFTQADYFSQIYRKDIRHYAAKVLRHWRSTRRVANYAFVPHLRASARTWLVVAQK